MNKRLSLILIISLITGLLAGCGITTNVDLTGDAAVITSYEYFAEGEITSDEAEAYEKDESVEKVIIDGVKYYKILDESNYLLSQAVTYVGDRTKFVVSYELDDDSEGESDSYISFATITVKLGYAITETNGTVSSTDPCEVTFDLMKAEAKYYAYTSQAGTPEGDAPVIKGFTNKQVSKKSVTVSAQDANLNKLQVNGETVENNTSFTKEGVYIVLADDIWGNYALSYFVIDKSAPGLFYDTTDSWYKDGNTSRMKELKSKTVKAKGKKLYMIAKDLVVTEISKEQYDAVSNLCGFDDRIEAWEIITDKKVSCQLRYRGQVKRVKVGSKNIKAGKEGYASFKLNNKKTYKITVADSVGNKKTRKVKFIMK